jgi:DNA repair protein RecN (Recombination protein N)
VLADITISDLGVISSASAELSSGLTVLTGETGAGKTMVVTGLRLLAGGRADASRVRAGAKRAVVEGTFITDELTAEDAQSVADIVDTAGGEADENGEYVASRTVMSTGRSKAHLGGRTVPAATLNEFSRSLLTVHGQNDQLRLLAPDQQLAALDRSSGDIAPLVEKYRDSFLRWRAMAKDLKRRTESRREMAQEVDRLQFAVNEIAELNPQPGEDEELITLIKRLQDVDGLREAAQRALLAIDGEEGDFGESKPASTLLGEAHAAVVGVEDQQLGELSSQLGDLTSQLAGIAGELGQFLSELPADPDLLEKSLQRQQELRGLTRKYAGDIDGVLAWKKEAEAKLLSMDTSTEAIEKLQAEVAQAQTEMVAKAEKLTAARTKAAKKLAKGVTEEIHGLAMPKARLEVDVRQAKYSRTGADEVELLLAANDAANPKPLSVAASGGELSRVMLALEVILSAGSAGTTLVFDEVDAGVGGRAAVEIGRRLARLAQANQVLVVTHLPQVAAYADTHLHVAKDVTDKSVTSGVMTLSNEERVEELARMLAGLDDTATGRAHAAELLSKAQAEVEGFRR